MHTRCSRRALDIVRSRRVIDTCSRATLLIAGALAAAHAEDRPGESSRRGDESSQQDAAADSWWGRRELTGNWGGLRDRLDDHGLNVSASLTAEGDRVFHGGLGPTNSSRALVDVGLTYDLEQGIGWRGASIGGDVTLYTGDVGLRDTGAFQEFSNIDSDQDGVALSSAWFEQWLADDLVGLRVGRISGSDFDSTPAASGFLDTSALASPTVYALPAYPTPAPMAEVILQPGHGLGFEAGVAHAGANDSIRVRRLRRRGLRTRNDHGANLLYLAEVEYEWDGFGSVSAAGRVAVGGYHHVEQLVRFDGTTQAAANGAYATLQQQVLRRASDDDDHGLFVFAQVGTADRRVSDVVRHHGLGVSLIGTSDRREDDECGIYVSVVRFTDEPRSPYTGGRETDYEAFYRVAIAGWWTVQPDFQLIVNPSDRPRLRNAEIGTIRTVVTF